MGNPPSPGQWTPLSTQPQRNNPSFLPSTMLLLADGTVMCQSWRTKDWFKLVPDSFGDYAQGTWQQLSSMNYYREFYASAVLSDGRVFVAGGENGGITEQTGDANINNVEIYDPVSNVWKETQKPHNAAGTEWPQIGDAPCCVLMDGTVLLGSIEDTKTAIYDPGLDPLINPAIAPKSDPWAPAGRQGPKTWKSAEETWTLLPDGSVVTVNVYSDSLTTAEKYLPWWVIEGNADKWVSAGNLPSSIVDPGCGVRPHPEIGPAFLLPDGRVFAIGGQPTAAFYSPPQNDPSQPGEWAMWGGDPFPSQLGAADAPGCLLPNGNVLCVFGVSPDMYVGQCKLPLDPLPRFLEIDPVQQTWVAMGWPGDPNRCFPPFACRMLLVPTGQVLVAGGDGNIYVYTPDPQNGTYQASWQPQITKVPQVLNPSRYVTRSFSRGFLDGTVTLRWLQTYQLEGTQINGLSQAVSYGDDAAAATNYPLVRIRNNASGKVWYCRTSNHSTMGVATGQLPEETTFAMPFEIEGGPAELFVVANGIPSPSVTVTITPIQRSPKWWWVKSLLRFLVFSPKAWFQGSVANRKSARRFSKGKP